MVFAEPAQRLAHGHQLLSHLDVIVRAVDVRRERGQLLIRKGTDSSLVPKRIDREIASDPEEPASEGGAALQRVHPIDGPCKTFLADILSVLSIRHQMAAKSIECLRVPAQQNLEGLIISILEAADEIRICKVA